MTSLMKIKKTIFALILLLISTFVANGQSAKISPNLRALVETERAFAKYSVEQGQREAFLQFFAEDGVNFVPQPVNTKSTLLKRPPTPKPFPFTLNWQPVFGEVSNAGDLGFTTGPYTVTDHSPAQRPVQNGIFFSIWKKQADASWKVVADFGVATPQPFAALDSAFEPATNPPQNFSNEDNQILQKMEAELVAASQQKSWSATYAQYLSTDARYFIPNEMPLIGKKNILRALTEKNIVSQSSSLKTEIAVSGDLGYAYGSFSNSQGSGFYLRVWRKNKRGKFEIAAQVFNLTA